MSKQIPEASMYSGNSPEIRDPERYAANPYASVFDGSLAREVLGFRPTSSWREIVNAE
ncbi:hypothetical protein [Pandoraea sp.]|uniref:hypothetical protein n=1 Tax=Pandoraea sp. TaxID=1883445 RepID=UPI0025EAFC29|nr:hypothetical protein [Pandoraea sp.]